MTFNGCGLRPARGMGIRPELRLGRRGMLGAGLALAGLPHVARRSMAQGAWPTRPVRLVVAYPAGGGTDIVARLFSDRLSQIWGQPAIVDNRGGAAGTIGKELSATPNDVLALWGHYKFEADALAGLGIGAGVRYSSESYGDDTNSFRNAARTYVDAALSYDFGYRNPDMQGLTLQVNAKNLFNKQGTVCQAGNCYRDEGRSVFGSLRYRF